MKIQYGHDIALPGNVPSLRQLVHQHYDEVSLEENPWVVRASMLVAIEQKIGWGDLR